MKRTQEATGGTVRGVEEGSKADDRWDALEWPRVLVISSVVTGNASPTLIWLRRYFENWPEDRLFSWQPGLSELEEGLARPIRGNGDGSPRWPRWLLGIWHRAQDGALREQARVLAEYWLSRAVRRRRIDVVLGVVELDTWPVLRNWNGDGPSLGAVVLDDPVAMAHALGVEEPTEPEYQEFLRGVPAGAGVVSRAMYAEVKRLSPGLDVQVFEPLSLGLAGERKAGPRDPCRVRIGLAGRIWDVPTLAKAIGICVCALRKAGKECSLEMTIPPEPNHLHLLEEAGVRVGVTSDMDDRAMALWQGEMDGFILPVPAHPAAAELVRTQFPSKLPPYLASKRPILYVGPRQSPSWRLIRTYHIGECLFVGEEASWRDAAEVWISRLLTAERGEAAQYDAAWERFSPEEGRRRMRDWLREMSSRRSLSV